MRRSYARPSKLRPTAQRGNIDGNARRYKRVVPTAISSFRQSPTHGDNVRVLMVYSFIDPRQHAGQETVGGLDQNDPGLRGHGMSPLHVECCFGLKEFDHGWREN